MVSLLFFKEGKKRSRLEQYEAPAGHLVAAVEEVLGEDADEHGRPPVRARKVFVPVSVIEAVKTRFGLPSFCEARKSSAVGWELLHDLLTKDKDVGREVKLEVELAALREERDLLKLRSVESTVLRNANFEAEFGIDKETFDWV
jgi:hypothetical protein